ncbi:MAG: aspartyl-phosphate phosphatase Spo0E family protein [Bacillota bacterium]|jgi:hypothetical protein|nr:aspartyl-phosphate phosphatase Spo0E family protein [Bacillota bacterium]
MRKTDRAKDALVKLERLKVEMERLVAEKGIDHPDVLALSQQADEALNEYNRLMRRRRRSGKRR